MRLATFALVAFLAVPTPVLAEGWAAVRSPRFEVMSDAGEAVATDAARRLERLCDALGRLLPVEAEDAPPVVRVLLFESRASFESLTPKGRGGADLAGFFEGAAEGPQMVVWLEPGAAGAERWRTLDHEYVHVHLSRSLPAQPVWVSEGLAEALSAGDLDGAEARLAGAAPAAARAASPSQVLAVDWDSPVYRGSGDTAAFYAGSLALVRWVLARHGLGSLLGYTIRVADGADPREAFVAGFGPPEAVTADALAAVPAGPLLVAPLDAAVARPLAASVPSEADVHYRTGEVLLRGGRARDAERCFEAAVRSDPAHGPSRGGLAQVLLQEGRFDDARRELRLALAARPDDPVALTRHARLLLAEGRSRPEGLTDEVDAEALAALERAVVLAPDLAEAVELLAHERPEPLEHRIHLLQHAFAADPGRAELGLTLSGLLLKRHDVDAARAVLRRSRDAARDDVYRFLCDYRLENLREYAGATAEARGRLVRLDCRRDGSLLFTLATAGGELPLEALSRQAFFVGGGESEQLELVCGAQDVAVRVRYRPSAERGRPGALLTLDVASAPPRRSSAAVPGRSRSGD